jgi:putative FmdB family regulatory protein
MPLYEYTCQKCQHGFESLVNNGDTVECPACKSRRVERMLSVPAKPRVNASLPMSQGCRTDLPPCGPGCCRL